MQYQLLLLLLISSTNINSQREKPTRVGGNVQTTVPVRAEITTANTKEDYSLTSPRAFRLIKTLIVLNAITATSLSYAFPDAFNMNK